MANLTDHVAAVRRRTSDLLELKGEIDNLMEEYASLDIGNELVDADFTDSDISKAEFVAAVGSLQTVLGAISGGHDTNLYRAADGNFRRR